MATERSALLILLWLTAVAAHAACLKTTTDIVNAFSFGNGTAAEAIYALGRQENVCFGLRNLPREVFFREVSVNATNQSVAEILQQILRNPTIKVRTTTANVVELVYPSRVRALFDLTVADYTIPRAPLKSAAVGLQLRVAKNLDPSIQGFAGSFNPGVRTNLVGPFAEHGRTVQDLLNLIVGSSKGALWVATVPDGFRLRESPARFPIWSILEYQMSPAECRAILQNIGRDYPDPEQ